MRTRSADDSATRAPQGDLTLPFASERRSELLELLASSSRVDVDLQAIDDGAGDAPGAPPFVGAVINFRGRVIPRVGMRWRPDFIRLLARRGGDLIVIPDLDQILAARGKSSGINPLKES